MGSYVYGCKGIAGSSRIDIQKKDGMNLEVGSSFNGRFIQWIRMDRPRGSVWGFIQVQMDWQLTCMIEICQCWIRSKPTPFEVQLYFPSQGSEQVLDLNLVANILHMLKNAVSGVNCKGGRGRMETLR